MNTTNFFLLGSEDNYNAIGFPDVGDWQKWMGHGTSIADIWYPANLKFVFSPRNRRYKQFDLSGYSEPLFAVSEKALDVLGDILRRNGDILPIASPDGFCFFHCTNVVDALVEEESDIAWLDEDLKWLASINKFVLDKEKLKNQDIIRLPNGRFRYTLFGEGFKKLVIDNNLKGIHFNRYEPVVVR